MLLFLILEFLLEELKIVDLAENYQDMECLEFVNVKSVRFYDQLTYRHYVE